MEERIVYNGKTYVLKDGVIYVRFKRHKPGKRPLIVKRRLQRGKLWKIIAERFDSPKVTPEDVQIGDLIYFRAATRSSDKLVWRKVNGFTPKGSPTVRFGWPEFIVRFEEIKEVKRLQKG